MADSRRVLIVVSFARPGGAQLAALRLARGLRDRGHETDVVFLYEKKHIEAPDHPYEVVLPAAKPSLVGYVRMARRLWRRLRQERPDAILTFMPFASIFGQALAVSAGVKTRVTSHRVPADTVAPVMRYLDRLWAWLGVYTDVVAVSESVRQSCRTYPARVLKRTVVVYNGVRNWTGSSLTRAEARERWGTGGAEFVLVAIGRLQQQKNYPLMLQMMERLENTILLVAGDGPLRADLERQIEASGLKAKVRLLGNLARRDIPDLLAAADVFVQTSTFEGQSNAVLEAMHADLPVVAHDVPEQRETIAEEGGLVAGELVPLNDIDAWAKAVNRLCLDASARAHAVSVARRRISVFRYETMISGFERTLASHP